MKKLCALLGIALLLCLAACGANATEQPAETQMPLATTVTESLSTTAGTTVEAPEMPEDIYFDVFRPALELCMLFRTTTAASDSGKSVRRSGVYYYRVTDPRFISFAAMEATLGEFFSEELVREIMGNSPFKYPLYIEHEGEIYAVGGRGFPTALPTDFGIEEQSGDMVIYNVRVAHMNGREKEYRYVRELIDGKWIFTEFPLEWMAIVGGA